MPENDEEKAEAVEKRDSDKLTVTEQAKQTSPNLGVEPDEVDTENAPAPFAVEDQDTSGFIAVSEEYRTYSSEVDKPGLVNADVKEDNSDQGNPDSARTVANRKAPAMPTNVRPTEEGSSDVGDTTETGTESTPEKNTTRGSKR